jgi:hypothetical protein
MIWRFQLLVGIETVVTPVDNDAGDTAVRFRD